MSDSVRTEPEPRKHGAVQVPSDASPPDPSLVAQPAANSGTILGRVVNANHVRFPNVEVTVTGPSLNQHQKIVTDERGIFVVENTQPGWYRVTVDSARLSPQDPPVSTSVKVTPGEVATLTILGEAIAPDP